MFKQSLLIALIFLSFAWLQCSKNPVKEKYLEPPFNLVADSGLEGRVYLTWQAPMAGGEIGYRLYRKKSGENYSSIATVGMMSESEYTDTTVTNDIIYCYVVTALYSQEESEYSNQDWALPGKNQPPEIEKVKIDPDTLNWAGPDTTSHIEVWVKDNQGLADVVNVQFKSIRPDSSERGPFNLLDDGDTQGISGDRIAGDGIFSIIITIGSPGNPQTLVGRYTFIFTALDHFETSLPDTEYFYIVKEDSAGGSL